MSGTIEREQGTSTILQVYEGDICADAQVGTKAGIWFGIYSLEEYWVEIHIFNWKGIIMKKLTVQPLFFVFLLMAETPKNPRNSFYLMYLRVTLQCSQPSDCLMQGLRI
jgi:hypothetical protein